MKKVSTILLGCSVVILMSFMISSQPKKPWVVPDKYIKMINPVKSDDASVATGKTLYNKHCKSCHGTKGKGDGSKAAQLDTECGDFTTADFKKEVDGALFYKTFEGRDDMPSYKKKIPEADDIWAVVNYMRTLQ
ncbi:MAG: cytochrome c [Ferruginibacter sp.]